MYSFDHASFWKKNSRWIPLQKLEIPNWITWNWKIWKWFLPNLLCQWMEAGMFECFDFFFFFFPFSFPNSRLKCCQLTDNFLCYKRVIELLLASFSFCLWGLFVFNFLKKLKHDVLRKEWKMDIEVCATLMMT